MSSQTTSYVPPSPVMMLPYDVFERIFLLCLPENPLDEVQPNTQIAPMLLCHICSSWRATVLGIPALWSHLNFRPHILWRNGTPIASNPALVIGSDMECLHWWRKNQRDSLIRLQFRSREEGRGFPQLPLPSMIIDIFIHLVSSARYLDVDPLTPYLFRRDKGIEFSQLESLVTSHINGPSEDFDSPFLPFNFPPTLRHLCLHDISVPHDFIIDKVFASWSKLTHLSLHSVFMHQDFWYSLIRSVPNLQWGYFAVSLPFSNNDNPTLPAFSFSFLSTLSVVCPNFNFTDEDALGLLLSNLRFPVLHDLSIYTEKHPRNVVQLARRINGMLKCAPAVTKLTLGFRLSVIHEPIQILHWDGVEKLSETVPHLTHLVLDMRANPGFGGGKIKLPIILEFWEEVLRGEHFVDVHNPSSAIRKITAVVEKQSVHSPLVEEAIVRALELDQEKNARIVTVEVVGEDKQEFALNSNRWKTWGMSL